MGEILNIMSGLIKAHIAAKAIEQNQAKVEVNIGLPGYMSNASSIAKVRIGPIFGLLAIIRE